MRREETQRRKDLHLLLISGNCNSAQGRVNTLARVVDRDQHTKSTRQHEKYFYCNLVFQRKDSKSTMFMYGRKKIGMLLTTKMEIMNAWKFSVKETRKKKSPSFRFQRVKVPNKFSTIRNGSCKIAKVPYKFPSSLERQNFGIKFPKSRERFSCYIGNK